tara:strand:- start:419 stop:541 length:123 start_codon:yes stop_codon:yes gene_type:complete
VDAVSNLFIDSIYGHMEGSIAGAGKEGSLINWTGWLVKML